MLRVLQVIGKMDRAGAETMIMNLYRKIDRTKVQFDFLVFSKERADYDDEIEKLGGRIYRLSSFQGINYIKVCREIKKFFKIHNYRIVHGHIGSLAPVYLKHGKRNGGYGIAHSHGCNSKKFWENFFYFLFAYRVRFVADYYMACSLQAGIDRFGKRIVKSPYFKIVNNGVDSELYRYSLERHEALKDRWGLKEKLVFGHVGRFVPLKNHDFLLKVFKEIAKKQSNSCLVLAGAGPEEDNVKKIAERLEIQDKVIFLGVRSDIPDILNLIDAFIFPSLHEGLTVVGVEAQASGLPCFFSEGNVEETVITENAWRYPLDIGAEQWADLILKKMEAFVRRDTMRDIIDAKFDIKYTAQELQEFYLRCGGKE